MTRMSCQQKNLHVYSETTQKIVYIKIVYVFLYEKKSSTYLIRNEEDICIDSRRTGNWRCSVIPSRIRIYTYMNTCTHAYIFV